MQQYETVIGLEVHIELATKSKIFCACSAEFGSEPNQHVCPACCGMPGLLPVTNKKVVELAITAGLLTNCHIAHVNTFDKKNYYYPDLSTSYQITQLFAPICVNGAVEIETEAGKKIIRIKQIHMEEDAGKLVHDDWTQTSLVDYNRASVPLTEIVSEPDFSTAEEVVAYLETLRSMLRFARVSDCKMEEGSMRCDVNISVRPVGTQELGVRTEVKNMASTKAITRAIAYEVARHIDAIENGTEVLVQETRRWDDVKNKSFAMRSKENAADYRYFPNPDLMPVVITEEWIAAVRATLPELPAVKLKKYVADLGLSEKEAGLISESRNLADLFEEAVAGGIAPKDVASWICGELMNILNRDQKTPDQVVLDAKGFIALLNMVSENKINRGSAKKVFAAMYADGVEPVAYVKEQGLEMLADDGSLETTIAEIIAQNPKSVEDYKGGKVKAIDFLFGQAMKTLKGRGDAAAIRQALEKLLNS